ncbi:MAG: cupin domain-containing protein [Magnetococcales bacterium]|nr:cupin domain-containing protein [Magnetococcales bacterium]
MRTLFALIAFVLIGNAVSFPEAVAADYKRVEPLVTTTETIVGEKLSYPTTGQAEIRSLIVTMQPGEETGWHTHGVPTYGYVLSGTLIVDYGDKGERTYRPGTGFMEAMAVKHNGRNPGAEPVRILVVFMGAEEAKSVVRQGENQ